MSVIDLGTARDVGDAIRAARKAARLRQEDVALETGYSAKFLGDLERGKATARLDMVLDVIRALGGKVRLHFPDTDDDS